MTLPELKQIALGVERVGERSYVSTKEAFDLFEATFNPSQVLSMIETVEKLEVKLQVKDMRIEELEKGIEMAEPLIKCLCGGCVCDADGYNYSTCHACESVKWLSEYRGEE